MGIQHRKSSMRKQQGIIAVILTIAMLAILTITALAIDVNHMYMNRTKLQNGVDAAALAAAVVLDNSSSQPDATIAANNTLTKLVSTSGNSELDLDSATISVTYNSTAAFDGGECYTDGDGDCYVRVVVNNMDLTSFFMQLFTDTKQIAASAVAGRSAGAETICNVAPITVCADYSDDAGDPEDGGYVNGDVYSLKTLSPDDEIAAGNFHLLNLESDESSPNNDVKLREQLAGGYLECATIGDTVQTKPGGTVGSFAQGINTRFGDPSPQIDEDKYVGDKNTDEGISYSLYTSGEHNNRRMLVVPIIDCSNPLPNNDSSNDNNNPGGVTEFNVVTLGCFFMVNRAPNSAGQGQEDLKGEYVSECSVLNAFNDGQSSTNGPYRIVLYKDPFNEDS